MLKGVSRADVELRERIEVEKFNALRDGLSLEEIDRMEIPEDGEERIRILDGVKAAIRALYGNANRAERSSEEIWLDNFRTRFDALTQLHEGIKWADVERSLKANPEAMRKLQALDGKGHAMNVFGEDVDEFIFASGWNNYKEVSADHRNIVFDAEAQKWLATNRPGEKCNGNATDIAKVLGVDLADTALHKQLRRAINVNGWAWLKPDAFTRQIAGLAFYGNHYGIDGCFVYFHSTDGSFRAALRVKKA